MAGAYGTPVAGIGTPSPAGDLAAQIPDLSGLNKQLSGVIGSELSGDISPETMQMLKNASATFGVSSGMPNSGLSLENLIGNIGETSEAQIAKGVANYNQTIPTISGTQTVNPSLQTDINLQNAVSQAAPNPTMAAETEQSLLQQYMDELQNPAGASVSWSGKTGSGSGSMDDPSTLENWVKWANS